MRKTTLLLCFVYALFFSCSEEDHPQSGQKEQVQFGFDLLGNEDSGGRISADIPEGAVASVEIWGPDGTITKELEILKFGDSYLSSPVELTVGTHKLLSFLIVSEGEVLFAAPKEGSPLESAVDNALPHTFNVRNGSIKNVPVQVIAVGDKAPEAFGYASFGIEVVRPLAISVFVEREGKLVLTEAAGSIYAGGDQQPVQEFQLDDKVNYIPFKGTGSGEHTLVIRKGGYASRSVTFTYDDLGAGKSIAVTLETLPTLVLHKTAKNNDECVFAFDATQDATLTVDWGDGNIETVEFVESRDEFGLNVRHTYADADLTTPIRITGDLDYIKRFALLWQFEEVDLSVLPNLEILGVEYSDFHTLDVSANHKLVEFVFIETLFHDIVLGDNKTGLKVCDFIGIKDADMLGEIISELHANAVRYNITGGTSYGYSNAPFTSEMMSKLQELDNTYGWEIQQEGYE